MKQSKVFKVIVLLSILSLAFLVPSLSMARTPKKPAAGMYFRLVTHGGNDPFWAVVQKGMRDASSFYGCKADIDLCGGNLALQEKRFAEAVAMRPDGIALVINDDKAWDKPVADAIKKGVNVIGINNDDSKGAAGNARLAYIGQDDRKAGYTIARRLFGVAKKKGLYMGNLKIAAAVEVPGANYGVFRSEGIKKAMKEFGINSKLIIIDAGGLEMTTVESRITSYLIAHPNTKVLFGLGGICTDRLTSSLKNAGKRPDQIVAGGFDAAPGTITGLKTGYVEATVDQQQYLQGYFAISTLFLMKKYGFAPNIDTGGFLVDKHNIATIEKYSPMHIR